MTTAQLTTQKLAPDAGAASIVGGADAEWALPEGRGTSSSPPPVLLSPAQHPTGKPHGGILADYLSRTDIARELDVSERTITRWTFEPDGIPYLVLGNRTLYARSSVAAWLAARERRSKRRQRR